jgi:A/G-specific adenine glycosylase
MPTVQLAKVAVDHFAACRAPLLSWFRGQARELPWRRPHVPGTPDDLSSGGLVPRRPPYAVWISEIMLQQTLVAAVIPHFERWMRLFPGLTALAAAPEDAVLRAWAGLGYYARARNLHRGAKILVAKGVWPHSAREWREVPGVGDYTSGAVASIAFDLREPLLDGNVARVFSRLFGLNFLSGDGAEEKRAYWELARHWADAPHPGALNEALMELGALVCVPGVPRCDRCPLVRMCAARAAGWQTVLPPVKKRDKPEAVPAVAVVASHSGCVLAEVRSGGVFLAGHTMFPLFLADATADWRTVFRRRFPGWDIGAADGAGRVRHVIMTKRYDVEVWAVTLRRSRSSPSLAEQERWLPVKEVGDLLTNSLARKIWATATKREGGG